MGALCADDKPRASRIGGVLPNGVTAAEQAIGPTASLCPPSPLYLSLSLPSLYLPPLPACHRSSFPPRPLPRCPFWARPRSLDHPTADRSSSCPLACPLHPQLGPTPRPASGSAPFALTIPPTLTTGPGIYKHDVGLWNHDSRLRLLYIYFAHAREDMDADI